MPGSAAYSTLSTGPAQARLESASVPIPQFKPCAMQFGNAMHEGQAEAAAFGGDGAAAIETLDEAWQFRFVDAGPAVGDTDRHFLVPALQADTDRAVRRRIALRVVDQVAQGDAQEIGVAIDDGRAFVFSETSVRLRGSGYSRQFDRPGWKTEAPRINWCE